MLLCGTRHVVWLESATHCPPLDSFGAKLGICQSDEAVLRVETSRYCLVIFQKKFWSEEGVRFKMSDTLNMCSDILDTAEVGLTTLL